MGEKGQKKEVPAKETSAAIVTEKPQKGNKPQLTQEQLDLVKNTVAKGATNDELKLFMIVANRTGLDPFSKQIHFVKRKVKDQYVGTIQTGIDGYLAIAERSGELAGIEEAVYDTEAEKHPNKATVTVYRIVKGVRVPFIAAARWAEYCPSAPNDFMWKKMPYLMLGKVALALALRKAFPNDLSGVYAEEETQNIGGVIVNAEDITVKPDVPEQPALPAPTQKLFETARSYGALEGEEKKFIEDTLGHEIDWDAMDDTACARMKTQLVSKLTPRS